MRIVLLALYFLSLAAVILAFYGMNYLSATLNPASEMGISTGNGNPALIVLVFAMPFFLYFIYGTIEFSMRFARKTADSKKIAVCMAVSSLAMFIIGSYTMRKAQAFHGELAGKMETVEQVNQLGLWNTYSNPIFFNPLTFLLLVLMCFFIGNLWGISKRNKN